MTARQPKHAQPSILAGLRLSSAGQWLAFALVVALVVGILATVEAPAHPAAARAPAPPAAVASTDPGDPLDGTGPQGEQPPAAVSLAPTSSTVASPPAGSLDDTQASSLASDGIPSTALLAYQQAAAREAFLHPACGLTWPLLAGIGRAESDHGRFAGAVLHTDGISTPRVIGIALTGSGTARIFDTDGGRLDGDRVYDRAVGPMQFIPSTWAAYGVDANGDGVKDPFNIFDAAAGSASYLCSVGSDLRTLAGQMQAVRVYNDSDAYISVVLQLEAIYASGVPGLTVPVVPADPNPTPPRVTLPPVDPGPPLGIPKPKPPKHKPTKKPTKKPTPSQPASSSPQPTQSACPTPTSSVTSTVTATPTPSTSTTDVTPSTSTSATSTSAPTSPSTSATSTSGTGCPTPTVTVTVTPTQPPPTDSTSPTPPTDPSSSG